MKLKGIPVERISMMRAKMRLKKIPSEKIVMTRPQMQSKIMYLYSFSLCTC
jgi:hypothetical protein